jgi:hypothetical protein
MTVARGSSAIRYVSLVGGVNRWFLWAFLGFGGWIMYVRSTGGTTTLAHYFFLMLFPLASGTGVLTSARQGKLDLLFGAGYTRKAIWLRSVLLGPGLAACVAAMIVALSTRLDVDAGLRLTAFLVFTGGVAFTLGLVETRYFTGVVWLLTRIIFMLWPSGFATILRIERGSELPPLSLMATVAVFVPEVLLYPAMPTLFVALALVIGTAALLLSLTWFLAADFGGHRT